MIAQERFTPPDACTVPTPFAETLLLLLHPAADRSDQAQLSTLSPSDWEALIREAIRYRLAFPLSTYLKENPAVRASVPAPELERLNANLRFTQLYNLRNQGYLRRMLDACAEADIPFLLMKGLWLVETIYRNTQARLSGDIDLLIKPEDMPRFTRLAQQQGFAVPAEIGDIRAIAAATHEYPLKHQVTGAHFDIHWALTHPGEEQSIDEGPIWQRAETVRIAGRPCLSPCLEDHLLLLCFHATIHHRFIYVGPRALVDIATLIRQPPRPIDWSAVVSRARDWQWERGVWLILELVREHLGVAPPDWVLLELRPTAADDLHIRQAALEALFLDQRHRLTMGRNVVRLMNEPTWSGRLAFLGGRLFPSRQVIATQFQVDVEHPGLVWLYFKRWAALLKRISPKLVDLWRGNPTRRAELQRTMIITDWLQR